MPSAHRRKACSFPSQWGLLKGLVIPSSSFTCLLPGCPGSFLCLVTSVAWQLQVESEDHAAEDLSWLLLKASPQSGVCSLRLLPSRHPKSLAEVPLGEMFPEGSPGPTVPFFIPFNPAPCYMICGWCGQKLCKCLGDFQETCIKQECFKNAC